MDCLVLVAIDMSYGLRNTLAHVRVENSFLVGYETGEDEDNLPGKLISQVRHLLYVVDSTPPPVAAGAIERLADLEAKWGALRAELDSIASTDIAAVNQWARDHTIPHISLPN